MGPFTSNVWSGKVLKHYRAGSVLTGDPVGCDVHMVLETKDQEVGDWVGLHAYHGLDGAALEGYIFPPTGGGKGGLVKLASTHLHPRVEQRNYNLFAEIANVRGEGSRDNPPKGIPSDASSLTRLKVEGWEGDGHSHSWLLIREFVYCYAKATDQLKDMAYERILNADPKKFEELVLVCTGGINLYFDEEGGPAYSDVRIVFWFDN